MFSPEMVILKDCFAASKSGDSVEMYVCSLLGLLNPFVAMWRTDVTTTVLGAAGGCISSASCSLQQRQCRHAQSLMQQCTVWGCSTHEISVYPPPFYLQGRWGNFTSQLGNADGSQVIGGSFYPGAPTAHMANLEGESCMGQERRRYVQRIKAWGIGLGDHFLKHYLNIVAMLYSKLVELNGKVVECLSVAPTLSGQSLNF